MAGPTPSRHRIEPRATFGSWFISIFLHTALLAGLFYLVFIGTSPPQEVISVGELRQVVDRLRENQRERVVRQTREMAILRNEMQAIRDQWLTQAALTSQATDALDDAERDFRSLAQTPVSDETPLDKAYDLARAIEQDMLTIYREFLAARTVGLGGLTTYMQAYDSSATPRPTRPELDTAALFREISTTAPGGGLQAFKDEIKKSTIETREMLENAKRLLAFTRKSNTQTGDGVDVDLSAEDAAMLEYRGPTLRPHELANEQIADTGDFTAIPGRRLTTTGRTSEWLYVDTWYIIGPFEGDRRREKLDVRFGPEASVNLDDVFTGKRDRKIRWDYTKTGYAGESGSRKAFWKIEPRVVETYAVYYAFTEIYADQPIEVWMAMGTDDYGKLWINDELVWKSPQGRKPYNATENLQLVRLRQGVNKVLYRVENAGGTMGFSLLMRLAV